MNYELIKAKAKEQRAERAEQYPISMDENTILIDGFYLTLLKDYKNAFSLERLATRYSPFLGQYDYWVCDLSDDVIRIKGFYEDDKKVSNAEKITQLEDYLYEMINPGSPYFIVKNNNPATIVKNKGTKQSRSARLQKRTAAIKEVRERTNVNKKHRLKKRS